MSWLIRYKRGTELACRFPGPSQPYATRQEVEALLRVCVNAHDMEIIEDLPAGRAGLL